MPRTLRIAAPQFRPLPAGDSLRAFAADVDRLTTADPAAQCLVYPELHLFGTEGTPEDQWIQLRDSAVELDSPFVRELAEIARSAGVWLVPGSLCERGNDGKFYNTAVVLSPQGELAASYRKIFPWRPYELHEPGDEFVVFDIPGVARVGLSICYDAWFPEVARHLGWMGAEIILNVVKTTSPDRAQEVVLAQANSIVNQTFTVSINTAGPDGEGRSLIVDPEGQILQASLGKEETVLTHTIDLEQVRRVREVGTAGFNRVWSQFLPTDSVLELPLYGGRLDPSRWTPPSFEETTGVATPTQPVGGGERDPAAHRAR